MRIRGKLMFVIGALWGMLNILAYEVNSTGRESPEDFTAFLDGCSLGERVALMQSLRGLKKIELHCYGNLKGLEERQYYTTDKDEATISMPLLPTTYNEVSPDTVVDAIAKGYLSEDDVSVLAIKKEMVWRRYNKMNYPLHEKRWLDYHNDYVMWSAKKCDVDENMRNTLSTFHLEQEIFKKYFEKVWDKLSEEQRNEVLRRLEAEHGSVGDKVAIAAMSGAAAISALSVTVACTGFAFYTSLTTAMAVAAGWVGVTLPFAAYTTATASVSVLAGPVGWVIAGAAVAGGGIVAGWPDKDLIISFVMTVNAIKAKKIDGKRMCKSCSGQGYEWHMCQCSECQGTCKKRGWFGDKKCPSCNGTGQEKIKKICTSCGGRGDISANVPKSLPFEGSRPTAIIR